MISAIQQPDGSDRGLGQATALGGRDAREDHGQLDVLDRSQPGHEVKGLKDESDAPKSNIRERLIRESRNIFTCQKIGTATWRIETSNQIQQRALARTGRAHDGHVLAILDRLTHAAQGVERMATHHVGTPQIDDLNHRAQSPAASSSSMFMATADTPA